MTYVIGDVHGEFDSLRLLVNCRFTLEVQRLES